MWRHQRAWPCSASPFPGATIDRACTPPQAGAWSPPFNSFLIGASRDRAYGDEHTAIYNSCRTTFKSLRSQRQLASRAPFFKRGKRSRAGIFLASLRCTVPGQSPAETASIGQGSTLCSAGHFIQMTWPMRQRSARTCAGRPRLPGTTPTACLIQLHWSHQRLHEHLGSSSKRRVRMTCARLQRDSRAEWGCLEALWPGSQSPRCNMCLPAHASLQAHEGMAATQLCRLHQRSLLAVPHLVAQLQPMAPQMALRLTAPALSS